MVRLLLVVLLAAVLWIGWGRGNGSAHAETKNGADVRSAADALSGTRAVPRAKGEPTGEQSAAGAPTAGSAATTEGAETAAAGDSDRAAVGEWVAAIDRDVPEALASGYAQVRKARGAARSALVDALDRAMGRARGSVGKAAVLGANNSFLHSPEGRRAAEAVLAEARNEDAPDARLGLTRLIEAGMRGNLRNEDRDARAALDAAYRELRPALLQTVLSPAWLAGARTHTVASGETLDAIARKLRKQGVPVESGTLMALNRIGDPRKIRAGQKLKVPVEPISTVVEKRSFCMAVYVGSDLIRLYRVAHGREGRTPEAEFTIGVKKEHPDWYSDGRRIPYGHPDNVLGDYWVEWRHESLTGFGAHGTSEPDSIGTMASAGCIRMSDADIEDYFRIVPRGSRVIVRSSR